MSTEEKWILATVLGAIFLILASPEAFKVSSQTLALFGIRLNAFSALMLHTVFFILLVRLLMK